MGKRPFGARFAVLVKGYAGLWRHARVPWLWAGGSRRLCARRGRIALGSRIGTAQLLAALHCRSCHGDDRAAGGWSRLDGGAPAVLVSTGECHAGAHLVAQVAVPPRIGTIHRGAGDLRWAFA